MKKFKVVKKNNEIQKQNKEPENKTQQMLNAATKSVEENLRKLDLLEKEKKNMLTVEYLDNSLMNMGLLSKPFYIMSKNLYDSKDYERSDYVLLLSDNISGTNEYVMNTIIGYHTRGFMLSYMNGILEQLIYEFESLKPDQITRLRTIGMNFQDAMFRLYKQCVNVDMVYKFAQVKYGIDTVNKLFNSDDTATLERWMDPVVLPVTNLCAKKIFAVFLSALYDAIYEFILFEGDGRDYVRVTESIKDILYDFEDKLSLLLRDLTYSLLMTRIGDSVELNNFEDKLKQKEQ